jgi:hypothetical protein
MNTASTMLISYEPNSDVLTLTLGASPVASVQQQGVANVSFDALGAVVSVVIPNASTALWEHGGQVQVLVPPVAQPAVPVVPVVPVVPR